MIKIDVPARDLWLGIHKEQGPFLYDAQSQSKLKDGVIRLFILKKEMSRREFITLKMFTFKNA